MTTSVESGRISNVKFGPLVLTWDPERGRIVGQFLTTSGPISKYQYWNIIHKSSNYEVMVQNIETRLFVRVEDGRLTCGNEPATFIAIQKDGVIVFQVPNGPTWDLQTPVPKPGEEVVLVPNGGEFTDNQKWRLMK